MAVTASLIAIEEHLKAAAEPGTAGPSHERILLTELIPFLALRGSTAAPPPGGRAENSPGWSEAESGDRVPSSFPRPVGPRRTSSFPPNHLHAIALPGTV
jgi:hypothetical protein